MKTVTIIFDTVEFAKALADETRQKIMALCCCELLSVNDIVDKLDVAQPTVSHHLKILKNAGLVKSERRGKQILYTLDQKRLAQGCCQVAEDFAPSQSVKMVVQIPD
ncbi:MAG: winged helix-turn-helix transcriptional regulator [Anaerolineales bacterium]|nr:winged helix-turn-helix transcriptional regulator [Chloroflexota bacterium]MBL6980814.1 winged helix-turn-helix transcriptional regulator [Anaerolineales bacterium]